jgi:hypothetical protein
MARNSRFPASRWKPGMVYGVPLRDGSFCFVQALAAAMPTIIDLAVFSTRVDTLPERPPKLRRLDLVSLAATWRQALNRGDWAPLGACELVVDPSEHPNQRILRSGTIVGITHSDSGLIGKLLNAWYGLIPWNFLADECYFDKQLAPGITRPPGAVVLGSKERAAYRAAELERPTEPPVCSG